MFANHFQLGESRADIQAPAPEWCNPEIDFVYTHVIDGNDFFMDTREIRKDLKNVPLYDPQVVKHIAETIEKAISEMGKEGG